MQVLSRFKCGLFDPHFPGPAHWPRRAHRVPSRPYRPAALHRQGPPRPAPARMAHHRPLGRGVAGRAKRGEGCSAPRCCAARSACRGESQSECAARERPDKLMCASVVPGPLPADQGPLPRAWSALAVLDEVWSASAASAASATPASGNSPIMPAD